MTGMTVKNILVYVDGDLMGDGLMKLPMIRALRAAYPGAHITWCAGKLPSIFAADLAPFVRGLIDEVIEKSLVHEKPWHGLRRPLNGRRFDLVIDTQTSVMRTLQLRRIKCGRFISATARFLFSDARPASRSLPGSLPEQLVALAGLAAETPAQSAAAPLPLEAAWLQAAASALPPGPVYVGFAPGAGGRHKCWPLEYYIDLARKQVEKGRIPVFILGPSEADWADEISRALPTCVIPSSLAEDTRSRCSASAAFTVAVGQRLALAVSNDSGCGHLLAASDVPLVSLFGPTSATKFRPAARLTECIEARNFGQSGMAAIPVAAVESVVERMLGRWQSAAAF